MKDFDNVIIYIVGCTQNATLLSSPAELKCVENLILFSQLSAWMWRRACGEWMVAPRMCLCSVMRCKLSSAVLLSSVYSQATEWTVR